MDKSLNYQIEILKFEIQDLLKNENEENRSLIESKKLKLDELLKELKQNKEKEKSIKEYSKVSRVTYSLEYSRLNKKANSEELLKNLKESKEKANKEFLETKEIEELYKEYDSNEFPSYLFFDKNILEAYKICPFILIEKNKTKNDEIFIKRKEWLSQQYDSGQLYYNIYEKICNDESTNQMLSAKRNLENYFENEIKSYLNERQLELYDTAIEYIKEYTNCNIKTKKIKEKFKIVINNLSLIYSESGLSVDKYLTEKYSQYIPINNLVNKSNSNSNNKIDNLTTKTMLDTFDNNLEMYINIKKDIDQQIKYVRNIKNNLKQIMYQYILNKKNGIKPNDTNEHMPKVVQTGKYFKKWSELKSDEVIERLESFTEYYVEKFLIISELIEKEKKEEFIEKLNKILKENFLNKKLKYKFLKWNSSSGCIEKISNLKYNNDLQEFNLEFVTNDENISESNTNTSSFVKTKKPTSVKSIFNKNTEKIINEELILFIMKSFQANKLKNENNEVQKLKDEFLERIKIKLKLKRITNNDKSEFYKKFDEIYFVMVNENDYKKKVKNQNLKLNLN